MNHFGPVECWDCGGTDGPFVRVRLGEWLCEDCDDAARAIAAGLRADGEAGQ
ncbi:hypothetical protein ACFY1P_15915 [Streptomyces sp. NPDC001407]|uniref:hypothetical protein n=1 Tax=Streptomyces sp. NPDC001407 TaxID=3364573 RepID=UPI0036768DDE